MQIKIIHHSVILIFKINPNKIDKRAQHTCTFILRCCILNLMPLKAYVNDLKKLQTYYSDLIHFPVETTLHLIWQCKNKLLLPIQKY
jgi:hypothetical protein